MSTGDGDFYRSLRFLVIDDQPAAREGLRICAQTMGAFAVDLSSGYQDAIARIRRAPPDVILCDYLLGNDRSGQQLLEELRRFDLLADEAVFMMVTAEQSYEQVVAAVELAPDDYIIKPFSPDRLKLRLDRTMRRKRFLEPLFVAKRVQDFERAERFIKDAIETEAGRNYRFELMRQEAEVALLKGDPAAAETAFLAILETHPFPWARAGQARALLGQRRLAEARSIMDEVVADAPNYFGGHDLKADICLEMGDYAEGQRTLEAAAARTGRNYERKRRLADAALLNGDTETARQAMADVIRNDTMPGAVSIADHLMLVRSHVEGGDLLAAERALAEITPQRLETASLDERASSLALRALMRPDAERERIAALRASWLAIPLCARSRVDIVRAAFAIGDNELAVAMAAELFASDEIRRMFKIVRDLFEANDMAAAFRDLQRKAALQRIGSGADGPSA